MRNSILREERHHNFGFNLSRWDYIFKIYQVQPKFRHMNIQIGLTVFW